MVYAFAIHTLSPLVDGGTNGRLLFSCFFGSEDAADAAVAAGQPGEGSDSPVAADGRTLRKERLSLVARQVQSEFAFRKAALARDQSESGIGSLPGGGHSTEESGHQPEEGIFRLAAGDPFQTEKVAVWLGAAGLGLVLVCEKAENRPLAGGTLRLLLRHLQDYVQAVAQPAEVLSRPDRVAVIVHHLLPGGRLLFMNHAVARQIEKEMDSALRGK